MDETAGSDPTPVTATDEQGEQLLVQAASSGSGRAATTVHAGPRQRQALMALRAGAQLGEHSNPGDATLLVLRGRVRLRRGAAATEADAGKLVVIPDATHALEALEDALVLLTVPKAG